EVGARAWCHAGVVDERVEAAERLERTGDEPGPVLPAAHVALHGDEDLRRVACGTPAQRRRLVRGRGVGCVTDRYREALRGSLDGDAAAEATARAGDEHDWDDGHRGPIVAAVSAGARGRAASRRAGTSRGRAPRPAPARSATSGPAAPAWRSRARAWQGGVRGRRGCPCRTRGCAGRALPACRRQARGTRGRPGWPTSS